MSTTKAYYTFQNVIKISKIFWRFCTTWPSLDQGLLPTSRHFENRWGEGPGNNVVIFFGFWTSLNSRKFPVTIPVEQHFSVENTTTLRGTSKFHIRNFRSIWLSSKNWRNFRLNGSFFRKRPRHLFLFSKFSESALFLARNIQMISRNFLAESWYANTLKAVKTNVPSLHCVIWVFAENSRASNAKELELLIS